MITEPGKICSFQAEEPGRTSWRRRAQRKQRDYSIWTCKSLEYISSSKLKPECYHSYLHALSFLAPLPSLSRGRACPWHLVQPNQALLVVFLPWSHYIGQLSICVFWLNSIGDPTVVKSKVILAKSLAYLAYLFICHTDSYVSLVGEHEKTRPHEPLFCYEHIHGPWVKNVCYRVDCWSWVDWLLRATNRQALPCSLRYAGGLLHLQPRSKHPSSRSNSSNMNAESSGHPHPLDLRPIVSALPSKEGRARNQAYKYWAYSFVRVY